MKTVGIIAEYNPFHYGHLYQLRQAKAHSQADCLVVLMSGNVVQRGEFPILDKWQRAQLALQSGADLIIELPMAYSLQAADYFAAGAVDILKRLAVDYLVFGTEEANLDQLSDYASYLDQVDADLQALVRQYSKTGLAYPAAHQAAVDDLLARDGQVFDFDPASANHLLGLQYLKNLKGSSLQPIVIPRVREVDRLTDCLHLPRELHPKAILSGTQIRQQWPSQQLDPYNLPMPTWQILNQTPFVDWSDYEALLQYAILAQDLKGLARCAGMVEGMEVALYKANLQAKNFDQLVQQLTSTRWTRSAIQRLLMRVFLQINQAEWQVELERLEQNPSLRVLALNDRGRDFIKQSKGLAIRLFANLDQELARTYQLTLRLDRIYQANPRHELADQITGRHPLLKRR